MSKKRFRKLILHFVLALAAVVVLLIAILFLWLGLLGDRAHRCRHKGEYYVEA